MENLVNFINESVSNKDLVTLLGNVFGECKTREDYKNALNSLSFALYKYAEQNLKHHKKHKNPADRDEWDQYWAANQFSTVINSLRMDIDTLINDDKYWREIN